MVQAFLPLNDKTFPLQSDMAMMLSRCDSYASLEEHTQRLQQRFELNLSHAQTLRAALEQAAAEGMLLSRNELLHRITAVASDQRHEFTGTAGLTTADDLALNTIAIVTANRLQELHCCLSSLMETAKANGSATEFLVADDSNDPAHVEYCKAMLRELGFRYGAKIHYSGVEEKKNTLASSRKGPYVHKTC